MTHTTITLQVTNITTTTTTTKVTGTTTQEAATGAVVDQATMVTEATGDMATPIAVSEIL